MLFVDLKTAFDKVDRKFLWENLRRKGISEEIFRRIRKSYEKTKVKIRTSRVGYMDMFRT